MIKIAVDAMGGDNAPQAIVEGVNKAIETFDDIHIQLYGDQEKINQYLKANPRVSVLQTTEVITGEDEPVKAVRRKKDASMVVAAKAVKAGEADALVSAGNTGGLLATGLLVVGRIKNIDRPGLMPILPTFSLEHKHLILMDAGANADTKVENLHQFAILANYYAKKVLNIENPRIGLVNNGTEEGKGNELTKQAYELLKNDTSLNFYGNIEASTILNGLVDIAIVDGFTGNAILKTLEGTARNIFRALKDVLLNSGIKAKLGGLLVKDALGSLRDNFDDTKEGGAVMLGVKAPVIKAHGSSNGEAFYNAIRQARKVVQTDVVNDISNYFESEK
ncbi:phosphate acyltransferase PlsX [Fundicoccus culcitae]|uniref:Phosphate acyltransferase n=1 Tax=Fundicoccus culcitae TaxID=2969821 RepID=A0ABY5P5V7_9LACT|nr:phosphate acyltransferase PlsX [Fundicoccus culcitae]UUX34092.1 phosphate acyltransferase PlsX [Fundicoccus culcitae]